MCLVIILFRPEQEFPLLLAANRDESYERPGEPPHLLERSPRIWGGRDPRAGGTWLGINEHGLAVALTDGPAEGYSGQRPSRGLLCLDALRLPSFAAVARWLEEEVRRRAYNAFNIFWSDGREAWLACWTDRLAVQALSPGLHMLANTPRINDWEVPKLKRCGDLLAGLEGESAEKALERLGVACADHGRAESEGLCVHGHGRGTLSSTILALHRSGSMSSRYLHVDSHPCEGPYRDLSAKFFGQDRS